MFSLDNLEMKYEPYPYGIVSPLFSEDVYQALVSAFPQRDVFGVNPINVKYVLSERINRRPYNRILKISPVWRQFHQWVKSDEFIQGVLDQLKSHHVDLGYKQRPAIPRFARRLGYGLGGRRDYHVSLSSRFEFSMLPADGGMVIPHTDAVSKVVTLVIPMVADGEWHPSLGGDTDINAPREDRLRFNGVNGKADFAQMDVVDSLVFGPNRALVFVRTYNSWHSVRPMTAKGSKAMRRTVTVNLLER
jgi:hypothetical protein